MNLRATQRKPRENRAAAGLGQVSRHTAVVLLTRSFVALRKAGSTFVRSSRRTLSIRRLNNRRIKLVLRAKSDLQKVRGRMPWTSWSPTRPEQLPDVLTVCEPLPQIADVFRNGPELPGSYVGSKPALSSNHLRLAVETGLRREIDFQGSGPVLLGDPINWHRDCRSGFIWPSVHHSRLNQVKAGTGTDARFPEELSLCQHWPHLAAAQEERQAAVAELLAQFSAFAEANPPGVGITYASPRGVAIRSVNWLVAFRSARHQLINRDIEHLCVELAAAGRFLREFLQKGAKRPKSHEDIVVLLGLYSISTMFPGLVDASEWYRYSGTELGQELKHQFERDGSHFEGSPAYARLALECYLFAYILGLNATDPRVSEWKEAIEAGIDHLAALILPNGELPRIGDDDAMRLLAPPGEPPGDARWLIQVGSVLFKRSDWKTRGGSQPRPGLDFWLGSKGAQDYIELPTVPEQTGLRVFTEAGLAVGRGSETLLIIQGGRRNHEAPRIHLHNDLTSMEYFADGQCWLLDPGTYEVNRQPVWRNRFRSTSAHNVIQLDDGEQNRLVATDLSDLVHDADPLPIRSDSNEITVGYQRAIESPGDVIRRWIKLCDNARQVEVIDRVDGNGRHRLKLGLNLARSPFTWLAPGMLSFKGENGYFLLRIDLDHGFSILVKDGWYSPRFGVRKRCFRVIGTGAVDLPVEIRWRFAAVPPDGDVESHARALEIGAGTSDSTQMVFSSVIGSTLKSLAGQSSGH
jgi:hypothetical protein